MRVGRWLLGFLAGAALVFNAVFFCRKKKKKTDAKAALYSAPQDSAQAERGAVEKEELLKNCGSHEAGPSSASVSVAAKAEKEEKQSLLGEQHPAFGRGSTFLKRDRKDSPRAAPISIPDSSAVVSVDSPTANGSKGSSGRSDHVAPLSPATSQPTKKPKTQAEAAVAAPASTSGASPTHADQAQAAHAAHAPAALVAPAPGGPLLAAELPPNPVDVDYLKGLIEHELGPPKFAKAKPDHLAHHLPGDSKGSGSLQKLLDQEFGPPKFAVAKQPEEAPAESAADKAEPARKPHLRLEVLSGPAAGHIFDTTDTSQELKIGRYPDCALALPDDQEVSGKHAVITFSQGEQRWKLTDVGSLNGTLLNGTIISHEYRQPGAAHSLAEGDVVYFGNTTRVRVSCSPSPEPSITPRNHAGAGDGAAASPALSEPTDTGMVIRTTGSLSGNAASASAPATTTGTPRFRSQSLQVLNPLGPHLAIESHASIAASIAVHQRLGADHKRTNTGCEDVVYWELPFAPYDQAGCLGIFDGHHGVKAAAKARELVPTTLRTKLTEARAAGSDGLVTGRDADAQRAMLRSVFLEADAALSLDEGCTATLVLVQRNAEDNALLLQSANVGDSSAVLVVLPTDSTPPQTTSPPGSLPSVSWTSIPGTVPNPHSGAANGAAAGAGKEAAKWVKLSEDHRIANSAAERSRLQQHGHTVKNRLYGLNISRMLGDKFLKDEGLGFIAEPHVSGVAALPPGCRAFLVIASDGLWDVVAESRAAGLVAKAAEEEPGVTACDVADILLNQALTLRSKDDISVIAVELRP